jgi:hypothetical protein
MQASEHLQVLLTHPLFAAIRRMGVQSQLGLGEPAVQRFGIDAQAMSRLGHRDEGHGIPPVE